MSKSKEDIEFALTQSDMEILKTLVGRLDGLPWNDIFKKAGLSPRTLSKRLKRLQELGIVERIIKGETYPPKVIYRFRRDIPPTKGDLSLVLEALRSFNYLRKFEMLTAGSAARKQRVGNKPSLAEVVKTYYSRLYPYFLWCLYYGSRVETVYAEEQVKKFYLDALKGKITRIIHFSQKHHEDLLKITGRSWKDLRDKDLKNQIEEGKLSFVLRFPAELQDLAESFYFFYLNKRIESWNSMLEDFKLIIEDNTRADVRRDFEEYFGREVPEYKLTSFLKALESISPVQSPQP